MHDIINQDIINVIITTLKVSLSAVIIAAIIAIPVAAFIATHQFKAKNITIILLNTLMGLPPVIVGLSVYLILSRAGPLGEFGILFTVKAMIIAQTCLIAPIIAAIAHQILEKIYKHYHEQLISFGAEKKQQIMTIIYDAKTELILAVLAGFGRAIAEVGAVMIVGGNIQGTTRVLTTAIALETSKGSLYNAMILGAILLTLSLIVNITVFQCTKKMQKWSGQ